jgi:hypothetical protein
VTTSSTAPSSSPALEWNLDLLDQAIARIEAEPDRWNQSVWRCGTGCCLAGHVALIAGARWASDDPAASDEDYESVLPGEGGAATHVATCARSALRMPSEWLSDLLDNAGDYRELFAGGNTLDDIKAMAADLHAAQDAAKAGASR